MSSLKISGYVYGKKEERKQQEIVAESEKEDESVASNRRKRNWVLRAFAIGRVGSSLFSKDTLAT